MPLEEVKKFVGKWKLDRSENFEDFLRELGVNFFLRKMAGAAKPAQEISIEDEDRIKIVILAGFKDTSDVYKLDEEFEKETERKRMKVKMVMEEGKIKLHQEPLESSSKLKPQTVYREIVGEEMLMTMYIGNVICKRWFKRQES